MPAAPITLDTRTPVIISARGQSFCVVDTLGAGDAGHGEIFICPVNQFIGAILFNMLEVIIGITIISDGGGRHVVLVVQSIVLGTSELGSTRLLVPGTEANSPTHVIPVNTFVRARVFCPV